jgi:hypothetical protein
MVNQFTVSQDVARISFEGQRFVISRLSIIKPIDSVLALSWYSKLGSLFKALFNIRLSLIQKLKELF